MRVVAASGRLANELVGAKAVLAELKRVVVPQFAALSDSVPPNCSRVRFNSLVSPPVPTPIH